MSKLQSFVSHPRYIKARLRKAPKKTPLVCAVLEGRVRLNVKDVNEKLIEVLARESGLSAHYLLTGEES